MQDIFFAFLVPPDATNMKLSDDNEPDGYPPDANATVIENVDYMAICTIDGSRPEATVAWRPAGTVTTYFVPSDTDPRLFKTTSTNLIKPTRFDHLKYLECDAMTLVDGFPSYLTKIQLLVSGK